MSTKIRGGNVKFCRSVVDANSKIRIDFERGVSRYIGNNMDCLLHNKYGSNDTGAWIRQEACILCCNSINNPTE